MVDLLVGNELFEPLSDRIYGRVVAKDVFDPITNEVLVSEGTLIDDRLVKIISDAGIRSVNLEHLSHVSS